MDSLKKTQPENGETGLSLTNFYMKYKRESVLAKCTRQHFEAS